MDRFNIDDAAIVVESDAVPYSEGLSSSLEGEVPIVAKIKGHSEIAKPAISAGAVGARISLLDGVQK